MRCISFTAGEHISQAADSLIAAAKEHGEAFGTFNDVPLSASVHTTSAQILKHYDDECARRLAEYRASPAGIAAERRANEERAALQARHDDLMRRLQRLDMADAEAVLDWLCQMQEPSDHTGVLVRRQSIVAKFEAAGYRPNENIGADYRGDDRNNAFRYLVGQALAGLSEGPAIHSIIHKFADEWRAKFARTPALTSGERD